jgi:hypothetical protein
MARKTERKKKASRKGKEELSKSIKSSPLRIQLLPQNAEKKL